MPPTQWKMIVIILQRSRFSRGELRNVGWCEVIVPNATIDLKIDCFQRKCPTKIYNGNTCLVHHPLRNIKQQFGKSKIRISIRRYIYLFIIFQGPTFILDSLTPTRRPAKLWFHRTSTGGRYDFLRCNVECLQEGAGVAMGYVSFKGRTKTPCATVSGTIWRFLVGKFG